MNRVTKRHVTLIEIMIAMALTVTILMTLAFFYQEVTHIGIELDKMRAQNFQLRYIENRLINILPRAMPKTTEFCFFSLETDSLSAPGTQSLIFTFDNRISLDNVFSNAAVGRLFVDTKQRLTIAYWPLPKRLENLEGDIPIKKEILLDNVEGLTFEFYIAAKNDSEEKEGKEIPDQKSGPEPKGDWRRTAWSPEFEELPALVRINIKPKDGDPMVFTFPLPNSNARIVYDLD